MSHNEGRSLVEVLLRGHLWVETHLVGLLESELANPDALNLDRMAFAQKVSLANALGLLSPDEVATMKVLNRMRNRLAHNLGGEPTEEAIAELEAAAPESQQGLTAKLLERVPVEIPGNRSEQEIALCRRLSFVVLALLAEMEMHSQHHAWWKEHRDALEGYRTMCLVLKKLGQEPETFPEYCKAVGIPEPPKNTDTYIVPPRQKPE